MKKFKFNLLLILIALILFFLPFFWLKPGEMDLGGDASRLYFYDSLSYLRVNTLYNIVPSGIGGEAMSYYLFPFMLILTCLKSIFASPTILISFFNGLKLSLAFVSCYLIAKELTKTKLAAILAGLFYIFSPTLAGSGWDRALPTHDQIFLNPLMFFLLLRYFLTQKKKYLIGALLITFVFSVNFSYVGAPGFFAFYPLSALFLFLYTKYIRKLKIPIKGLLTGLGAFILLQSFHLLPQLLNLFSFQSPVFTNVFSDKSKFSRGLDYFTAIAPSIKTSISLMGLPQLAERVFWSFGFIIFPTLILLAFFWNRKKPLLLTGIFFLITVFFYSANITGLGFIFYKALFIIPGFSMFRNFYGQWSFSFTFFYSLLLGQSLGIVLAKFKKSHACFLAVYIVGLLLIPAWVLISGAKINATYYQTKNIKAVLQFDPTYEKVLNFVRLLPVDGKILALPLVGPGYQVIAGKDGGVYIGPSTFSYLAGKNDFGSYDALGQYGSLFLYSARDKDDLSLQRLFSILNIKYIFYNSDPYIYGPNFPGSPYDYVRDFLPKNQESYRQFIEQLPLDKDKKIDFGDKYHLYPIKDNLFIPHIYTTDKITYTNKPSLSPLVSYFNSAPRFAIFYIDDSRDRKDNVILEAESDSPLFELKNNYHLHHHEPFISLRLDDIRYPLALLRERFELWKLRNKHNQYIDFSLFYLSKRILELEKWQKEILITGKPWKGPKIWEFYKWRDYNSWEASLARYQKGMEELMGWLSKTKEITSWKEANKIKINEQLLQHEIALLNIIKNTDKTDEETNYLRQLVSDTFDALFNKLDLKLYDNSALTYILETPKNHLGEYQVYLDRKNNQSGELSQASIEINGKTLRPKSDNLENDLLQFDNLVIEKQETTAFTLHLRPENLIKGADWTNSGSQKEATDSAVIEINNISGNNSGGLVKKIDGWLSDKQYVVSFDYLTFGNDFTFKLFDRQTGGKKKIEGRGRAYFERNINSKEWSTHQSVLTSDPNSTAAFIQIMGSQEVIKSQIYIRNLSVTEVVYPKIFFKKVVPEKTKETTLPQIIFEKINPTKYQIKVTNVRDAYTLVFLEAFNRNWRLVDPEREAKTFKGAMARFVGNAGRIIVGLLIKDRSREEKVTASYFGGEIKEGIHTNIFLEPKTFETWGKELIADDRHFRVNEYANGWHIIPADMDGKQDYVLILEMSTQKQFYPFLFVSLLTVFFLFIYFWTTLFKNK